MHKKIIAVTAVFLITIVIAYSYAISHSKTSDLQVTFNSFTPETQKEVRCLAENIYFESAHEPDLGKIAVAFVTLNRTKNNQFPSSICEVVTQKTKSTCQFSWYCQDKERRMFLDNVLSQREDRLYLHILNLASFVYANADKMKDPTDGSIFYHADYVSPNWKNVEHKTTIGRHIFYIKKGTNI
jgi:spore germination cell wall hydrolase CwlJ-like protein